MVELWTEYRLPMANGQPMSEPQDAVQLLQRPDTHAWGFHYTHLKLTVAKNSCRVSDVLQHLTLDERLTAETAAHAQLATLEQFPYSEDLAASMNWDAFDVWRDSPDPQGGTWVASISRSTPSGEHAMTTMSLSGRGVQLTELLP